MRAAKCKRAAARVTDGGNARATVELTARHDRRGALALQASRHQAADAMHSALQAICRCNKAGQRLAIHPPCEADWRSRLFSCSGLWCAMSMHSSAPACQLLLYYIRAGRGAELERHLVAGTGP